MSLTLSIITPSFNQGCFLEESIQSVLSQKGTFYIDYIIMDGGSGDNSIDIIQQYENLLKKNCNIFLKEGKKIYVAKDESFKWNQCLGIGYRWYSEPDNGQVDALKKGFRMANGSIYCWLNSDDIFVDHLVFQKVAGYFNSEPDLKLLTADGPLITKDGKEILQHHVEKIVFKELLFLDYHILQPSTFFSKDIYIEKNLNEHYTCAFDADFFIHMISDGISYKKVNDSFAAFRYYEDNKTLRLSRQKLREQLGLCWKYSRNPFYFLISFFYRILELMLKPRYPEKGIYSAKLFAVLRKLCYMLITGRPGRE